MGQVTSCICIGKVRAKGMLLIRWALPQIPKLISIQPQSMTQQAKYKSQQTSEHFTQSQVTGRLQVE